MNKKKKSPTIDQEVYEEALLSDVKINSEELDVQYGRGHDERRADHAKRQSSRPHTCSGPECEDAFSKE